MCLVTQVWVSNKVVLGGFVLGLVLELLVVLYILEGGKVNIVFEFNGLGD